MSYRLENIQTREAYICTGDFWNGALAAAREKGWEEEGTVYDLSFQMDECCDEMYGSMYNLFLVLQLHMEGVNWDGNYIDRENQVVSETDAYYMMQALEGSPIDERFLLFLNKGAFRIRDE